MALDFSSISVGNDQLPTRTSKIYRTMGKIYLKQVHYEKALNLLPENLLDTALIYNSIGAIHYFRNDHQSALKYFEKSLYIKSQLLPWNDNEIVIVYKSIVSTLQAGKNINDENYQKALDIQQKILKIQLSCFPIDSRSLIETYWKTGKMYYELNDFEMSIKTYESARALLTDSEHINYSDPANVYDLIGKFITLSQKIF
ncbi:unnamed protein product [Didymodactylos carnosus]|uniref:Uncharacterized protein n=1 Tax=Didymodactylos carnosus TaxID=1234261 RepID=A0A815VTL9_9BILA|nr:unnamed protein product [Didymodactylos carnosus]CAF1532344.1 unnamed protein product [Didymodactylos carnosus]CAF4229654.1 unnamed protein product [Didymodactylos carnosus]CAF4391747.1 unnamed protein product [Didymodactylos carnosus]